MFLESVDRTAIEQYQLPVNGNGRDHDARVFKPWIDWEPTLLAHHGEMCCEIAREWITATDFSTLNGGNIFSGPRWLREKFKWGACSHPIHWCDAVQKKTLDCGALAALAYEAFVMRGVKSLRAQFVQKFSTVAASQWTSSWSDGACVLPWISNDLIYHEGCAIAVGASEIKVWDSSAGWWLTPKTSDGYGSLLAIRITGPDSNRTFSWGPHQLSNGNWGALAGI
jgi:hypothetical protein